MHNVRYLYIAQKHILNLHNLDNGQLQIKADNLASLSWFSNWVICGSFVRATSAGLITRLWITVQYMSQGVNPQDHCGVSAHFSHIEGGECQTLFASASKLIFT